MKALWTLAVVLSIGAGAAAQEGAKPDRLVLSDAFVETRIQELIPLVEKHAGKEFLRAPEAYLADMRDVEAQLREDMAVVYRQIYRNLDARGVDRLAKQAANLMAMNVGGKYGIESAELLVVDRQIRWSAQASGLEPSDERAVFDLLAAHELVHALQDQHLGLGRRVRALTSADAFHGFNVAIEGHATWVTDRVAEELGVERVAKAMRKLLGESETLGSASRSNAFVMRSNRMFGRYFYHEGAARIARLAGDGGPGRAWEVVAGPTPPSRAAFTDDEIPALEDLSATLDGAERLFGRRRWFVIRGVVGDVVLRSQSSHVHDALTPVLDKLRGAGLLECHGVGPLQRGEILALRFTTEEAATEFVDLAISSAHVDGRALRGGEYQVEVAPVPEGARGSRYTQKPTKMGAVAPGSITWVHRGPHAVQVTAIGLRAKADVVREVVAEVLGRLEG